MSKLAKRGKGKYKADKTLRDAYKIYAAKFTFKNQSDLALNWDSFKTLTTKCLEEVMTQILHESKTFTAPYKLGSIRIQKKKMNLETLQSTKNLKVDWGYFQKTGKIIKHLNEDRDNYRYKFFWLCKKGPSGKTRYRFEALRNNKRILAKLIKTTNTDYFE